MVAALTAAVMSLMLLMTGCGLFTDYKNVNEALDAYSSGTYIIGKTVRISSDKDQETSDNLESLKILYKGVYITDDDKYQTLVIIEDDFDWECNKTYTVRITEISTAGGLYRLYGTIQK